MDRILLPFDLQHKVRHAVSVDVCAEGGGVGGGVIGQGEAMNDPAMLELMETALSVTPSVGA